MTRVRRRHVGRITISDLMALFTARGHQGLPYPFTATTPTRDDTHSYNADTYPDAEPAEPNDPDRFHAWIDTYVTADIWITSRTHPGTLDERILAHRVGDTGYLALQHGEDTIDVYRLDAHDLGPAVTDELPLTQPGCHPQIVVPGYIDYFDKPPSRHIDDPDDDIIDVSVSVPVRAATRAPEYPTIHDDDVTAVTIIQSRWQPAREWGLDWTKPAVVCLTTNNSVDGPGDYIYTPDYTHATPAEHRTLTQRINRLIADDITAIRHHRGIH